VFAVPQHLQLSASEGGSEGSYFTCGVVITRIVNLCRVSVSRVRCSVHPEFP
jgi:hypothetical protein